MLLYGVYTKTLKRDELTGETMFLLRPTGRSPVPVSEYGRILCVGFVQQYSENVPLELEGEPVPNESEPDRVLFRVSRCIEHAVSREDAVAFLSGPDFFGIGEKTAGKIVDILGLDFFRDGIYPGDISRLVDSGIALETANAIARTISAFCGMRDLLSILLPAGGTYQDAHTLYRGLGDRAIGFLTAQPYDGIAYGLSYSVCEYFAKRAVISTCDDRRLRALLAECFRLGEAQGNTTLPLADISLLAQRVERRSKMGYRTPLFHLMAAVLANEAEFVLYQSEDGEWFVSRRQMFDKELSIATHIRWLTADGKKKKADASLIEQIERTTGIAYAKEQIDAFDLLESPGVKVLTGGPGTGKTTVLNGLIQYYEAVYPAKAIRLCATTANAARRMRESTGKNATTVHKLLGLNKIGQDSLSPSKRDGIPIGLIIVDEASMLDVELFELLISRILPGSTLLLVGDEAQLESVGPGNILADLLGSECVPSRKLVHVFRQGETSSIFRNGLLVREGDTALSLDKQTALLRVGHSGQIPEVVSQLMERFYKPERPWSVKLLTPVRSGKYQYGSIGLNDMLQNQFNNRGAEVSVTYGQREFRLGDPVQFIRNNYKNGYINGDVGIVTSVLKSGRGSRVTVTLDKHSVDISGHQFEDLDLAYASTVHKAQGGECHTCIIVVPAAPSTMLYRKLVYVAMTRAKQRNIIITEGDALERAILNHGYKQRHTSLMHLFGKGVPAHGTV